MGKRRKCSKAEGDSSGSEEDGSAATASPRADDLSAFLKAEWQTAAAAAAGSGPAMDNYFNSYSSMNIHEEMLKDRVRTSSYYNAVFMNRAAFKDKVVLDIGAGTGVLSIFAAKAGARHVYSVEYSEIFEVAQQIIADNEMTHKITVIRARAEDAELPIPPNSVDVIISEWMGYCLLYESMLDCVLICRDKWLKPGGLILPDKVDMFIAGIEDGEYKDEKFSFWENVYGINYSRIKSLVQAEAIIDTLQPDKVISRPADAVSRDANGCRILHLDLLTCRVEDLDFAVRFQLRFIRNDYLHGFVLWFDCTFDHGMHKPIVLSTSPFDSYTHWKQTVFYVDHKLDPLPVHQNEVLDGVFALKKAANNPRNIDVKIKFDLKKTHSEQVYHIR